MLINADFTCRASLAPEHYQWVSSPQNGVERVMLDRVGAEKARATSIVRLMCNFVKEEFFSEEYLEMLDFEKLHRVLRSELFNALHYAEHIFVEKSFVYRFQEQEDEILLQGIIDMMYIRDDEITIVDYKTDRASEVVIRDRYQKQIDIYAKAIEEIIDASRL